MSLNVTFIEIQLTFAQFMVHTQMLRNIGCTVLFCSAMFEIKFLFEQKSMLNSRIVIKLCLSLVRTDLKGTNGFYSNFDSGTQLNWNITY